jgi:hypothetical protein
MTRAVLDACVLYPAALRDLLMRLTVSMAFQPIWTDAIQEPGPFVEAVRAQLAGLRNPPRTLSEHIELFRKLGLPLIAQCLTARAAEIES